MKLTTNEIMQRYQALLEISNNKTSGRIAMAIMCNLKALEDTYKTVEQTLEDTKIKYADKDEEGKPIIVNNNYQLSDENLKLLKEEYKEIEQQEFEVPEPTKVPANAFDNCEDITAAELYKIEFMIEH